MCMCRNVIAKALRSATAIAFLSIVWQPSIAKCDFQLTNRMELHDGHWAIEAFERSCSALDRGRTEIYAINVVTNKRMLIAKFNETVNMHMQIDGSEAVVIELPNLIDIAVQNYEFDDKKVRYVFRPLNDPQSRAAYRLWLHNPRDPKAIEWYRKVVKGRINPNDESDIYSPANDP